MIQTNDFCVKFLEKKLTMDTQNTAGQYEINSNFFNVWNISNLIPDDSVNLSNNFTENFDVNNQSILCHQNESGRGLSYEQSSSPLFLDEVYEILDNFIKTQSENCNPQSFTGEYSSENQLLHSNYSHEFHNKNTPYKTVGLTLKETSQLCNNNFIKPISDSSEPLSNLSPSLNQILNESVLNLNIPNSNICHFEKRIPSDDFRIEVYPPGIKSRKRTVFTNTQVKELNAAFKRNHYLNPDTLEQLALSLELPKSKIKVWFCNKRSSWKKQNKKLCGSNISSKMSLSPDLNYINKNSDESPKSYEYDLNSNQTENLIEGPEDCTYVPNLNPSEDPKLDCPINSISAYINKQIFLENNYSICPVELDERNVLHIPQNSTIYFEDIWN